MSPDDTLGLVWVVGPGRVGRALGTMLKERGAVEEVVYVERGAPSSQLPAASIHRVRHPGGSRDDNEPTRRPDEPICHPERSEGSASPRAPEELQILRSAQDDGTAPHLVLLTVRDEQIAGAAAGLARRGLPPAVVLHTSGAIGSDILRDLAADGWATGSMAPVVSIADPERDAAKLIGAWYAVEGDPKAVATAERIVNALNGRILRLDRDAKPTYHAAAVFASNYIVTVMAVAERLMADAGVDRDSARLALAGLATGTLENLADRGPQDALTGPISRGDVATIERHLARLSAGDRRLYSVLALETLDIARRRGLDPAAADRIARILEKAADT